MFNTDRSMNFNPLYSNLCPVCYVDYHCKWTTFAQNVHVPMYMCIQ